jgi:hypothetical protein
MHRIPATARRLTAYSIRRQPLPPLALRPSPKLLTERYRIVTIFTVSGRGLLTTHEGRVDLVAKQGQEARL